MLVNINHSAEVTDDIIRHFYDEDTLSTIANTTMRVMVDKRTTVDFPYFDTLTTDDWQKSIELDIYITDPMEGKQLNLDARQKDYPTNILSYPSDLPSEIMTLLPNIMLGELVICHHVVVSQSEEQGKSIEHHLTHLIVHGMLHLLGFDHELGENEQREMEAFEIEILTALAISNPYEC